MRSRFTADRFLARVCSVALPSLVASALPAAARSQAAAPPHAATRVLDFTVHEGTWLAFDRSRDGARIAFDLLGQIWVMPATGGPARRLTDAVRDTSDDEDPAFAPDGRSVVFAGERAGHAGLWRVELAGGAVRRLTTAPMSDDQPAWSPDGRTIAFVRQTARLRGGRPVSGSWLHLLDVATGAIRRVPVGNDSTSNVRDPAWSPDGRTIYLVTPRHFYPATPSGGALRAIDVASGAARVVGDSARDVLVPTPSPDGASLAYVSDDSLGRPQIWLLTLATAERRRLTDEAELTSRRIRWAGADTILFVSGGRLRRLSLSSLHLAEIPLSVRVVVPRRTTALPARHFPAPGIRQPARGQTGLALSPDGSHAAMIALGRLWIIPVRGGAPRAIARLPEGARDVDWAPRGDRLVFAAGSWGAEDLYAVGLTDGRVLRLTDLPGREVVPRWSPDGRWIAFLRFAPDSDAHLVVAPVDGGEHPDVAHGRDLGAVGAGEWTVGIESAGAPAWRLDSRALLAVMHGGGPTIREPFAELRPTAGQVIPLEGPRTALPSFPFDPTWTRWVDDSTIVYVDADRVWRARLLADGRGFGVPTPLGDDAALYLSAARDGTLLYASGDGLRVRTRSGRVRRLGWPVTYVVPTPPPLVIRNARVVDGTGAPPTPPRDVLLRAGRIARIGAPGSVAAPGVREIDAGGGALIPGIADLHSHHDGPDQLRGPLYFGITMVRDQGSDIATVAARADEAISGDGDLPRATWGGFQMYADWAYSNGIEQGLEPERDPRQLDRAVQLLVAHGAEHMKLRTFHGWHTTTRMIEAAHRAGLRTTGHCILPLALLAAGMDAKEHVGNGCGERFNAPLHDDVLRLLRLSGAAVDPTTMAYSWQSIWVADSGFLKRPDVAPFVAAMKHDATPLWPDSAGYAYWVVEQGRVMLEQTRALVRAGVPLGVGCDAPLLPWCSHLEMERLVEAGLTPLQALRAATLESARIAGHGTELGSVIVGKLADLVLLEPGAEPWRDIRDTRRIAVVILGGRVIDREGLRANVHAAGTPR